MPAPSNTSAFNSSRGGTLTNAIQLYSHRKEMYATSSVQKPKKENTVCLLDQYTVASSPSSSNLGGIQDSEENSNKPLRERFKHVISKADDISTEATSELIEADVPYSTLRPLVPNTFSLGKRERRLHTNKRHRHRGHSTVGHRRTSRSRCSVQHFFPVLIAINSVGILTVIYLLQLLLRK